MENAGIRLRLLAAAVAAASVLPAAPGDARASEFARFGFQDDAWLAFGPGTLERRLDLLERLGVQVVRYTLRWDEVARRRPLNARSPGDPRYDWGASDAVLKGLRDRGIPAIVSIWGTPRWANRGQPPNAIPISASSWRNFVHAAVGRFPWVRFWLVWNEPNQRRSLRPADPKLYVNRLLNPAYAVIKSRIRGARVGGGVTAPRAGAAGLSPVAWIRGMAAAGARLDAYAHHPYPLRPRQETPFEGGCAHCSTITMAELERLLREVRTGFGPGMRIWLTEWGFQTNPPDRGLGVSWARQARFVSEAGLRVWRAPRVDFLVQFLVRDEPRIDRWQSGVLTAGGSQKPSFRAFMLPLAQESREGLRTVVWGQVRPGKGRRPYRLQQRRNGRWVAVGGVARTGPRGAFRRTVRAGPGTRLRIWAPQPQTFSTVLVVR